MISLMLKLPSQKSTKLSIKPSQIQRYVKLANEANESDAFLINKSPGISITTSP